MEPGETTETAMRIGEANRKYPGAAGTWLVIAVFGVVVVIMGGETPSKKFEQALTVASIVALPVALALWRIAAFWDDWLFDPVFGPKTDDVFGFRWLGKKMRGARREAAQHLKNFPSTATLS